MKKDTDFSVPFRFIYNVFQRFFVHVVFQVIKEDINNLIIGDFSIESAWDVWGDIHILSIP